MIIKEAILKEEKNKVKEFLNGLSLSMPDTLEKVFYLEDSSSIIGTISIEGSLIKCFGIDSNYQGESISNILMSHVINYFSNNGIYSYRVYTKPKYKELFISFGFREIVSTDKVSFLEGGLSNINERIKNIKKQIEFSFGPLSDASVGAVVLNANPVTNGHDHLLEIASKNHDLVIAFIVEEDKSMFSFEQRFSLVYLLSKKYRNVMVISSTEYIVSLLTFPNYFLKDEKEVSDEYSKIDALIFKEYFMKELNIEKRYVGSEEKGYMVNYNHELKELLGDALIEIKRFTQDGEKVSASYVRDLLKNGKVDLALEYVPREVQGILKGIVSKW